MKKQLLVASLLGCITLPAAAQGIYLLGDIGQSKMEVDVDNFSVSKTDTTFSIGAGYHLNETFALEFSYRDLGTIKSKETDNYSYDYSDKLTVTALQASLIAQHAINDKVDIYGRLGFGRLNSDYTATIIDSSGSEYISYSQSKNKALFGIGASYAITPKFSLRTEYSRFSKWEDATLSSLTLGIQCNF